MQVCETYMSEEVSLEGIPSALLQTASQSEMGRESLPVLFGFFCNDAGRRRLVPYDGRFMQGVGLITLPSRYTLRRAYLVAVPTPPLSSRHIMLTSAYQLDSRADNPGPNR